MEYTDDKPSELYKELKPVTVYLGDLLTIENILKFEPMPMQVKSYYTDSDGIPRYVDEIEFLPDQNPNIGVNRIDNLEIRSAWGSIKFQGGKTIVQFHLPNEPQTKMFGMICKFLEKKQRKNPKQKQQLFLYHKNAKPKNFLTQSSIPNWVNILIQLLTLGIAVFAIFQK